MTLRVSKSSQVIAIGFSAELGQCVVCRVDASYISIQANRKDCRRCENFINLSQGDHCIFHVVSAAKKLSSRRGAFSSTSSQPPKKFTIPSMPVGYINSSLLRLFRKPIVQKPTLPSTTARPIRKVLPCSAEAVDLQKMMNLDVSEIHQQY